jgi:uncharacterized protein (TIGR00375 family)
MPFIADLHIHSKYSRATSKSMSPENLWKWAQFKGISVMGTGDFTHPEWLKELHEKLDSDGNGLSRLKKKYRPNKIPDSCKGNVSFLLTAEISCIYSKKGKTRKVHSIVFVPDFQVANKINRALSKIGNLHSDGRPILGLDARELLKIILDVSPEAMVVPAHAWTPHFSVFGAASGFDSLEECYEELTPHIYAIETGLSSDPLMNWRLSALDGITLISNSDAHSPAKIGREANILDTEMVYGSIMNAMKSGQGFAGTIEFFPEEGKYHYDGHRACNVSLTPDETKKYNYLCPSCGRNVTVGVMHRVDLLADRKHGYKPQGAPPYHSIIPLPEIISEIIRVGVNSKAVASVYGDMIEKLGNEFHILMEASLADIEKASSSLLKEAIAKMRKGKIHITPGYDGEFGKITVFE